MTKLIYISFIFLTSLECRLPSLYSFLRSPLIKEQHTSIQTPLPIFTHYHHIILHHTNKQQRALHEEKESNGRSFQCIFVSLHYMRRKKVMGGRFSAFWSLPFSSFFAFGSIKVVVFLRTKSLIHNPQIITNNQLINQIAEQN
jgi:hypothetical protein